METLEYINKAISKDLRRVNLTSAYYSKTELVACDGHRLHYKPHLEPSDKAYYLTPGIDQEYPDVSLIFNQVSVTPQAKNDIALSDSELKELRGLIAMFGKKREIVCTLSFTQVFEANKTPVHLMNIKIKHGSLEILWSKEMVNGCSLFSESYNLRYLVEAMDYSIGKWKTAQFTISYFGVASPLKIEHLDNCAAIVMPCKL